MKATLKVTDLFFNKSIELECPIRKDVDASVELVRVAKANSRRIIKELRLSFGEASLELVSYGRTVATGRMTNSAFNDIRPNIVPDKKAA